MVETSVYLQLEWLWKHNSYSYLQGQKHHYKSGGGGGGGGLVAHTTNTCILFNYQLSKSGHQLSKSGGLEPPPPAPQYLCH